MSPAHSPPPVMLVCHGAAQIAARSHARADAANLQPRLVRSAVFDLRRVDAFERLDVESRPSRKPHFLNFGKSFTLALVNGLV